MAHSSFCPPDPRRNGVMKFINFALVGDLVLIGVEEGLALLWSSMDVGGISLVVTSRRTHPGLLAQQTPLRACSID